MWWICIIIIMILTFIFLTHGRALQVAKEGMEYIGPRGVGKRLNIKVGSYPLLLVKPSVHNELLDLYNTMKDVFQKYKVTYWATAGTLLGAMRHNGFIPWDDDMDFSLNVKELPKLKQINDELDACEITFHNGVWKFRKKNQITPFIDLFPVGVINNRYEYCSPFDDGGKCTYGLSKTWPKEYINEDELFPLRMVKFEDTEVPVPNKARLLVDRFYSHHCMGEGKGQVWMIHHPLLELLFAPKKMSDDLINKVINNKVNS